MARQVDTSGALPAVARRVRRRRVLRAVEKGSLIAVVLVGTLLGIVEMRLFTSSNTAGEGATRTRIASATIAGDLEVVLIAERASAGGVEATVHAIVLTNRDGRWRVTGDALVGSRDGWRWDRSIAPGGVCRLVAADAPPSAYIEVSLATDETDGCSAPFLFAVERGRVVSR